jgi:acyl-coenzyme A thioesterase 13
VFVESWVVHLGKRMGLTMGTMRLDSVDGKVMYTCEHGKAAVGGSSL